MYLKHLSSLEFLTYVAFLAVVLAAIWRLVPGKAPPVRTRPYSDEELGAHDGKLAKYFVAGGGFLVLGSLHMLAKNLPWTAEWLARAGYAGHLVRDLSNTHVMIVGGGTLIATGLCWYTLPRIVGRPLASDALAQGAFWFTALGLLVFYVAFVGNGIAIGRLVAAGSDYHAAKAEMGDWYRVPIGMGAGVMGIGYWCFAATVFLTVFQARLVRVPKPSGHLWKFIATGAAGLTAGTVQGVIQVQPANSEWLYRAGHAGEWIDPIAHAHVNLVTGLTMLVAGVLFQLAPLLGGKAPSRRAADTCFYLLLLGSLAFYAATLYLGFHEGRLVHSGLTPDQAEEATAVHPFLLMGAGTAMLLGFWLLLALVVRSFRTARPPMRWFAVAGCAALAVGTLQGPVQAFPAVNRLLERGGDAGEVVVNLHAQLNMLGGLLVLLTGLALGLLGALGGRRRIRAEVVALVGVSAGVAAYYAAGLAFSGIQAYNVAGGASFHAAVARLEPWSALVLCSAAAAVLVGFGAFASSAWTMTVRQRTAARRALASAPGAYAGRIPARVRRRRPIALAGYEMPMALLGFPGVGWLFAGFPLTASVLLMAGPSLAWAVIPTAFSPYGEGPLRGVGWKFELFWLPASALVSAALLYRAHRRRRLRLAGPPPPGPPRRGRNGYRTRVSVALGAIAVVLVSLPFLPAVTEIGGSKLQYAYQTGFTNEITGQFLATPRGAVKLFAWRDPQETFPTDSLRVHPADVRSLLVRASVVDRPGAYRLFDVTRGHRVPLAVRTSSPRALSLAPARRLAPGRYLFVATHQGMFGGRDFAYLSVVPTDSPVTAIASHPDTSVPQIADALLPVAATLVAALFCLLLLRSFRRRPAGQKALWAAGFALFAVAAASEALAQRAGWSAGLFRVYYLAGGVLTVAYLGAGSAWLLLPRRARDLMLGGLVVATAAATVAVLLAPVDAGALAAAPSGRPPENGALSGNAFLWAIALNSFGTLFLVGGSIYSILRRQRVSANLWIGGGAVVVALATGLSRTGHYEFVYLGQLVGIALMFSGFTFVGHAPRPSVAQRSQTALGKTALAR